MVSFAADARTCVHAVPICMGWVLCVASTLGVQPAAAIERMRRARAVLALALVHVGASSPRGGDIGASGAPGEVFARAMPPRRG